LWLIYGEARCVRPRKERGILPEFAPIEARVLSVDRAFVFEQASELGARQARKEDPGGG
jgi:hypothetical protein